MKGNEYYIGINTDKIHLFTVTNNTDKFLDEDMNKSSIQIATVDKFDVLESLVKKGKIPVTNSNMNSDYLEIEIDSLDVIKHSLKVYAEDFFASDDIRDCESGYEEYIISEYYDCDYDYSVN